MFPVNGSLLWRLPSLRRVPVSPVPRLHRYYEGATTSRSRIPGHLWFRFRGSTRSSVVRARRSAPDGLEDLDPGQGIWSAGAPVAGVLVAWTRAGSHRFPGDPSHAFALFQDPGRADGPSPWRSRRCCPRSTHSEGSSDHNFEANSRGFSTCCLRFTSGVAAAHARLASGWLAGLYREGVEPSGSLERFQNVMFILLSRAFPVARVVYAKRPFGGPDRCWPISAATPIASPSPTAGSLPSTTIKSPSHGRTTARTARQKS